MTIHLPKEVERDILSAVRSGHYASVDDALVQAWHSLRQQSPAPTRDEDAATRGGKAVRPGATTTKKPLPLAEIHCQMMASGLISRFPDPGLDVDDDDPDDQPVPIDGEPLSETILRERR